MEHTDVVVIGGGIIGSSAAYFLAKKATDLILLDKAEIGREASGSTAGTMSYQNKKLKLIPLVMESQSVWRSLQRELDTDIEYRQPGGLRVAESSAQEAKLKRDVESQRALGVEVEILGKEELKRVAPYLGDSVRAASFCARDAKANPLKASRALAAAAAARGARVLENEAVTAIGIEGRRRFIVRTERGEYSCRAVLNCAGVWARDIFTMLGLDAPITLDTMQVQVSEPVPKPFPHIITHVEGHLTLKHVDSGNVVIGGGWRGIGDARKNIKLVDYESMHGNLQAAGRIIPLLRQLNIIRCWSGLEGRTPDFFPLLGSLKSHPGFYSACCTKGGFTLGPFLGKMQAELITSGKTPFPLGEFDVNRVFRD